MLVPRKIAISVDLNDYDKPRDVVMTSIGTKLTGSAKQFLAEIAVDAVKEIVEIRDGRRSIDRSA